MLTILAITLFALSFTVDIVQAELPVHNIDTGLDYATIQEAIDAPETINGHTIQVDAGIYYEHVTVPKSLTLIGEDRSTTLIDGGGSGNVIYITTNYVTISGFKVTNGEYGIRLIANWKIHHVTIRDVIITSNKRDAINAGHSYYPGAYHIIEDCVISNNGGKALYAHQFSKSIIQNCEVFDNLGGLGPAHGFDTQIINNKVHHNIGWGIYLDTMKYTLIKNCEIYYNTYGISHGGLDSRYNAIVGNIIHSNYKGLVLGNSRYNTVIENMIFNNNYGVYIDPNRNYGNVFYHNDFIANTVNALISEEGFTNTWDNGYPLGGNYWSDYTDVDYFSGPNQDVPGSDGIGDVPYVINADNIDRYPLMPTLYHYRLKDDISDLDVTCFTNEISGAGQKKALCRQVEALIYQVEAEAYTGAIIQLKILKDRVKMWIIDPWKTDLINEVDLIVRILETLETG